MPTITKHLPNFMEGFDQPTVEFSTLEELENIPFVKTWTGWNDFSRSTASDLQEYPGEPQLTHFLLSAYFKDGKHWVVGTLTPDAKDVLQALNAKDYNHEPSEKRTPAGSGEVPRRYGVDSAGEANHPATKSGSGTLPASA